MLISGIQYIIKINSMSFFVSFKIWLLEKSKITCVSHDILWDNHSLGGYGMSKSGIC
jgi:hypothetical protein